MDLSERAHWSGNDVQRRHPWELARAEFLLPRLRDAGLLDAPELRIVDVGSGDAWFARQLLDRAPGVHLTCWDLHYSDADLASLARDRLTPTRVPPAGPFDVALLLDVLEHVDDEDDFLRDVVGRLRPGARVLVTVPAWQALFSAHDVALAHHRRYAPAQLHAALQRAGLVVDEAGGFFHSLLVPRALELLRERVLGPRDARGLAAWRHGDALTRAVVAALRIDGRVGTVLQRARMPLPGLSLWAWGRKP